MDESQVIANLQALLVGAELPFPAIAKAMERADLIGYYDCWWLTVDGYWRLIAHRTDQLDQVVDLIRRFGDDDREGRKQWLINQILQAILGAPGYKTFLAEYDQNGRAHWDRGAAP